LHGLFATAKSLTLVSELAYMYVTTHFDLPSSPHFVADFLQAKCDFIRETAVLRFWTPCNLRCSIFGSWESA